MKLIKKRIQNQKLSLIRSAHALKIEANKRHTQGVIDFLKSLPSEK